MISSDGGRVYGFGWRYVVISGSVAACMQGYLIRQLLQPQPRRLKMKKITLMLAFVVVRK